LTKVNAFKFFLISLLACSVIASFTACKSEPADNESSLVPTESVNSDTVSIYYKDDASSKTQYEDIITDDFESTTNASQSDNLVEDAKPQLIIPSNKSEVGSTSTEADSVSSGDVSHKGEQIFENSETSDTTSLSSASSKDSVVSANPPTSQGEANHSKPSASEDNVNTSQSSFQDNDNQSSEAASDVNSEEVASKDESSSATSSYDKGYTKPY